MLNKLLFPSDEKVQPLEKKNFWWALKRIISFYCGLSNGEHSIAFEKFICHLIPTLTYDHAYLLFMTLLQNLQ